MNEWSPHVLSPGRKTFQILLGTPETGLDSSALPSGLGYRYKQLRDKKETPEHVLLCFNRILNLEISPNC